MLQLKESYVENNNNILRNDKQMSTITMFIYKLQSKKQLKL